MERGRGLWAWWTMLFFACLACLLGAWSEPRYRHEDHALVVREGLFREHVLPYGAPVEQVVRTVGFERPVSASAGYVAAVLSGIPLELMPEDRPFTGKDEGDTLIPKVLSVEGSPPSGFGGGRPMGRADRPWQNTTDVLGRFGRTICEARESYGQLVAAGVSAVRWPELVGGVRSGAPAAVLAGLRGFEALLGCARRGRS